MINTAFAHTEFQLLRILSMYMFGGKIIIYMAWDYMHTCRASSFWLMTLLRLVLHYSQNIYALDVERLISFYERDGTVT